MKLPAQIVVSLVPLALAGCFLHKTQKPPAQPLAPKIETTSAPPPPSTLPPPVVTIPPKPQVSETRLPAQSPKVPPKRKKEKPAPLPAETQQASSGQPAVSAIGQLTTGDPLQSRHQAEAAIAETERGLNNLHRQLNDPEKKTAAHIREFIKQAKAALASGNIDGASTLAAKAKVLLAELTK
jgi:hypothetical protein